MEFCQVGIVLPITHWCTQVDCGIGSSGHMPRGVDDVITLGNATQRPFGASAPNLLALEEVSQHYLTPVIL